MDALCAFGAIKKLLPKIRPFLAMNKPLGWSSSGSSLLDSDPFVHISVDSTITLDVGDAYGS